MPIPLVGLAGAAAGLYLHNRWRARGRRLSALVASGEHRAMLDRAAAGLGAEALETRLGAVESLRALRRDFPVLRREVEELLSRHLEQRAGGSGGGRGRFRQTPGRRGSPSRNGPAT